MERIGNLLGKYRAPGAGAAVIRALLIEEANRLIGERLPRVGPRAAVRSVIGRKLVVQCSSGVVAAEVRLQSVLIIAALIRRFPNCPIDDLKCLVLGSTLTPIGED